jgi:two-component system response regulator HydG
MLAMARVIGDRSVHNGIIILLVTKDKSIIAVAQDVVRHRTSLRLVVVDGVTEALDWVTETKIGLVLFHRCEVGPDDEAARLIEGIESRRRGVPTLVLSDRHSPEEALKLLRLGAIDYLSRPLDLKRLNYLIEVRTLRARYTFAPGSTPDAAQDLVQESPDGKPFMYSTSDAMGRLMQQVRRVAPRDSTILLGGETGTGKTRLARFIHDHSNRRDEPFLVVNCGALSATLIESEMFGHVRGAFTGADRDRVGKLEEAGRGTVLLDEIDSLPPALQAKLLHVSEERLFEPVGSNKSIPVRARLIAASNKSLAQEVAAGRFRADLFYRLNVVSFDLPPLRERGGMLPDLTAALVEEFAAQVGRPPLTVDPEALRAIMSHDWPGNIRELRNVVERAVILCDGDRITANDLPEALRRVRSAAVSPAVTSGPSSRSKSGTLSESKESAESSRILDVLDKHGNNRLRAAAELGISRMTLYKKLHKYNLMT